ncbi:MAG: response regulator [Verrucomicrobia bacterium]|nr:response regulator [Verrucomicrobiota bacterium]
MPYLRDYRTERFAYFGEGIEKLTGYTAAELTVELWNSIVQEYQLRGELAGLSQDEAVQKVRSGQVAQWQADCKIRTRDGQTRWLADASVEIIEGGECVGSIGLLQDITDRLNLEQQLRQLQKMETIGQLAGGVAHDFNNILIVIRGYCDLLQYLKELPADASTPLQQIAAAAERATGLTRQLLTFSRKQVAQLRSLDLNEIIGNLLRMLRRMLGEHIALEFDPAPALPSVQADPGMMEQVLMNLAVNARDAMPTGGKLLIATKGLVLTEMEARHRAEARAGRFVCLQVTDTGCGIPAEILAHIFEPFFTTKDVGKGTGLGLATVYGIVKQHQGWIELSTEVGRGTSFKVLLPAEPGPATVEPELRPREPVRGGSETMLVVEDEEPLRGLIRTILESYGYRVLEAASGVAALQVWHEHKGQIDLLFTDMVMPDAMTGRELAERLQAEKPRLQVIFTSGYSEEMTKGEFVLEEGKNFLQKPYHAIRLAQSVRAQLDESKTS